MKSDAEQNREAWDQASPSYQEKHGEQLARGCVWGVWAIPESELNILGDVSNKDVLELGCGAAMWSVFLARAGARVVALDNSAAQLEAARENQQTHGVEFPLIHAAAEQVPLPDASFDVVFCDHGAMSFTDPRVTVPEASRLLRPGGLFAFNAASTLHELCWDPALEGPGSTLREPFFEHLRYDDPDDGMVSFSLSHGAWIRLFRECGFEVEDLVELIAPEDAASTYRGYASHAWASKWPAEQIWKVRRGPG